jgi:hypothetical protein
MKTNEWRELHDHGEHVRRDPAMAPITLTMAILAVMVAAVSLLGHRTHTEEVMLQDKITDGWAYYQAKAIRRNTDQLFVDLTSFAASKDNEQANKLREHYQQEVTRYKIEQSKLEAETRRLENRVEQERKSADRYDLGEVFLEIALVVTSITLLSGRRNFWYAGLVLGVVGAAVVVFGLLS